LRQKIGSLALAMLCPIWNGRLRRSPTKVAKTTVRDLVAGKSRLVSEVFETRRDAKVAILHDLNHRFPEQAGSMRYFAARISSMRDLPERI
jgi:hypothetical protein